MQKTFTLIELLVVIAIIAILFTILLPTLSSAKSFARTLKCASNMKQFSLAFNMYNNDFNSWYPGDGCNWISGLKDYVGPRSMLGKCPDTTINAAGLSILVSYAYPGDHWNTAGTGGMTSNCPGGYYFVNMSQMVFPSEKALLMENWSDQNATDKNTWSLATMADLNFRLVHRTGANFLFADAHVEWLDRKIGTLYSTPANSPPVYRLGLNPLSSSPSLMHYPKQNYHWR